MLKGEIRTIFGNGEQIRDYVYVGDVLQANLRAIEYLQQGFAFCSAEECAINNFAYNIGTGKGTYVNELFAY